VTHRRSKLFELVDTANKMIAGEIGPIEGSRTIANLRAYVGDGDSEVFLPFIVIDSESDDIVVPDRSLWDEAFLDDIDRRYESYERSLRPTIANECRGLLAVVLPTLNACPVCGFVGSGPPPYDAAGVPSYETCRSCGMEFGITEEIEYDLAEWRRRWIRDGMPFRHPPAPPGWDAEAQLRTAKLA
jgi:hypothetical protein